MNMSKTKFWGAPFILFTLFHLFDNNLNGILSSFICFTLQYHFSLRKCLLYFKVSKPKSAWTDSPHFVTKHPKIYLQVCNCIALAWDLLTFHTSQPCSKLGHNTGMRMCLRILKSKAKLCKLYTNHLVFVYYTLLMVWYVYPTTCLSYNMFILWPITI